MKVSFLATLLLAGFASTVTAQPKVLLFDMSHGQTEVPGLNLLETYTEIVSKIPGASFKVNKAEITPATLRGVKALIVMTPFTPPKAATPVPTVPPAAAPPVPGPSTAPPAPGRGGRGFALATRFWGKDSVKFMQDVISWLLP